MTINRTTLARAPALAFCLAALFFSQASWAFRCNSNVVDAGMKTIEVMNKCGTPSTRDARIDRRIIRLRENVYFNTPPPGQTAVAGQAVEHEREILVNIEEWVYNFGPSQFMQLLVFEDGLLVAVRDLGYGS
jgi:hypothetical protein